MCTDCSPGVRAKLVWSVIIFKAFSWCLHTDGSECEVLRWSKKVVCVANAFKTQYLNRSAPIYIKPCWRATGACLYEAALCSAWALGICKRHVDVGGAPGAAKVWFQSFGRDAAMTDDKLQLIYDSGFRIWRLRWQLYDPPWTSRDDVVLPL